MLQLQQTPCSAAHVQPRSRLSLPFSKHRAAAGVPSGSTTPWQRQARGRAGTLLAATLGFAFTTPTRDKFFALIACCSRGPDIPRQAAEGLYLQQQQQKHQSRRARHPFSHNFDVTNPVVLSNFRILRQLSGLGLQLCSDELPLLPPELSVIPTPDAFAPRSCRQLAQTEAIVVQIYQNTSGLWQSRRGWGEQGKASSSPRAKPSRVSRKVEEVLPVSDDQSRCSRVTSECNFPRERLDRNDVSVFPCT